MPLPPPPLRFGFFFAPFHPVGQNPTRALEYDLRRTEWLDELGFDEVWFGEHHSGGFELIGSPEIFIAAAAQRTKHIKLGTGVTSLPYHHPFMAADRAVQLDHMTRGRFIFGVGPGALPTDAWMMGIRPVDQRRMMEESLDAILALLRSDEPVNRETDWFTMRDCRLQMRPYTYPHFEIAAAAMVSPSGPKLAGRFGIGLLSLSALQLQGFAALDKAWETVAEEAAVGGRPAPDRSQWRVLTVAHVAESKEQAITDCMHGLESFAGYFGGGAGFVPLGAQLDGNPPTGRPFVEAYAEAGTVIGTPDDLIAHIEDLQARAGGFGTMLLLGHDWADPEATRRSYDLISREVIPHFQGQLAAPEGSHTWATAKRGELFSGATEAIMKAIGDHADERGARSVPASTG